MSNAWVSPNKFLTPACRTRIEGTINKEIEMIVDQCSLLVARADSDTGFGHVAEHLTDLTAFSIYARGLGGIQRNWQMPTLVISSIDVMPSYQRRGVFTALCDALVEHCTANNWVLKIENVLVPHLRKYLDRRGFLPDPNAHGSELLVGSLYWMPDAELRGTMPRLDMDRMRMRRKQA